MAKSKRHVLESIILIVLALVPWVIATHPRGPVTRHGPASSPWVESTGPAPATGTAATRTPH
jgi:hypothetical protein